MDISQDNFQIWEHFIELDANSADPDPTAPFLALKVCPNVYDNNEVLRWSKYAVKLPIRHTTFTQY